MPIHDNLTYEIKEELNDYLQFLKTGVCDFDNVTTCYNINDIDSICDYMSGTDNPNPDCIDTDLIPYPGIHQGAPILYTKASDVDETWYNTEEIIDGFKRSLLPVTGYEGGTPYSQNSVEECIGGNCDGYGNNKIVIMKMINDEMIRMMKLQNY